MRLRLVNGRFVPSRARAAVLARTASAGLRTKTIKTIKTTA
jgi:hypothetical protein